MLVLQCAARASALSSYNEAQLAQLDGKRSRDTAWSHDTHDQLSSFEDRLPTLLAKWSIEQERQQWTNTFSHLQADKLPAIS